MDDSVLHFKDINVSKIKFKKMYSSSSYFSKVSIKYKKSNLIIQSPRLFIPYDLQFYGSDNLKCYLYLSLSNCRIQTEVGDFCNKLYEIEKLVKKKYTGKCFKKNRNFTNLIKRDINNNLSLKIKIPFYKEKPMIKVFNQDRKEIDFADINAKMYCETLLCIDGIWFYNDTFGLTINLLQIKLDMPIMMKVYSFSNGNSYENSYKNNPKYKKYFKMLDMGIPIFVVKQKMTLNGLDPNVLDGKKSDILNNDLGLSIVNGKSTLKKVTNKKRNNHIKKMTNMGHNVPTLDDIVNKLSSLKKIRKHSFA